MKTKFLNFILNTPFGLAPCPLAQDDSIRWYAHNGCSILTYRTIRSHEHIKHPAPNKLCVKAPQQLTEKDLQNPLFTTDAQLSNTSTLANSYGNASAAPEWLKQDIKQTKASLQEGQILTVSVYGQGATEQELIDEFVKTALFAQKAGADCIEANASCPNVLKGKGILYQDPALLGRLTQALATALQETPLLVKIGYVADKNFLKTILLALAHNGAQGITSMNSVPLKILNKNNTPAFGSTREYCGVSGNAIRTLALEQVKKISSLKRELKLNLAIIGVGGIMKPEHIPLFLQAGATIALSAAGLIATPTLAQDYKNDLIIRKIDANSIKRNKEINHRPL